MDLLCVKTNHIPDCMDSTIICSRVLDPVAELQSSKTFLKIPKPDYHSIKFYVFCSGMVPGLHTASIWMYYRVLKIFMYTTTLSLPSLSKSNLSKPCSDPEFLHFSEWHRQVAQIRNLAFILDSSHPSIYIQSIGLCHVLGKMFVKWKKADSYCVRSSVCLHLEECKRLNHKHFVCVCVYTYTHTTFWMASSVIPTWLWGAGLPSERVKLQAL